MLDIRPEARKVGQWHSLLEDTSLSKGSEILRSARLAQSAQEIDRSIEAELIDHVCKPRHDFLALRHFW
jgi:hypothetical protein